VKYNSEDEIKKALGIQTWRNLSHANVTRFAAMMPDMDKEVALKIVEQLPEFTDFALGVVNVIQKAQEAAYADNKQSMAQVYQAWQETREILKGQLALEDLQWEERKYILDLLMEAARQVSAKDSENKQWLKDIYKWIPLVGSAAMLMAVVYVGGKVGFELPNGSGGST